MSDVTQEVNVEVEQQRQEKLALLHGALLWNVGTLCVGYIIYYIIGVAFLNTWAGIIGMFVFLTPCIIWYFQSRASGIISGLFKMPEYEVITTTKDGYGNEISKTSDGGFQSGMVGLMMWGFKIGILLMLAPIVQFLRIIMIAIKYVISHAKVAQKPAFVKSGFAVMIAGVAVLIGATAIGFPIERARIAKNKVFEDAKVNVWQNPEGQRAVVIGNTINLRAEPVATGAVVKELQHQDTLTVIGTRSGAYMEVEFNGQRGWVYSHFIRTGLPDGYYDIILGPEYPYEARVTKRINAKRNAYGDDSPLTLEEGTVIQVTSTSNSIYDREDPGLYFKYNDLDYRMHGMNNIEFVVPVE